MENPYSRIAGQSLERLAALSDGLFAVAMTLIVLDIRPPKAGDIHSERGLWDALVALAPQAVTYLLSFLTLGIFWVRQQTQLNLFARVDHRLAWTHLAFLAAVATMPFSTSLLAGFITFRLALVLYWANILILGVLLYAGWRYARRAGLVRSDAPAGISEAVQRRIVVAQALYAFGALLCVINTYWSIGFIVLVQTNYALAPRIPLLSRLMS